MFERQMGSSKFAFFVLMCYFVGELLEFAGIAILASFPFSNNQKMIVKYGPFYCSGPYPLIFAEFVLYYHQVPTLYNFKVLDTFSFSNKSFIYIIGIQLFLMKYPSTLIISISSFVIVNFYLSDLFQLKKIKMPSCFDSFVLNEKQDNSTPFRLRTVQPSMRINNEYQQEEENDQSDSDDFTSITIEEQN